jgi:hypothetical protein
MIIHFSTNYDGEVFLNSKTDLMGVTYVGPQGLLQQLELRAGLHTEVKSDVEREADYLNAMTPFMDASMFKKAFDVDKIGVAGKLLVWRDNLLMAGWNGQCDDASLKKLYELAKIEQEFHSPGMADAWVKVSEKYNSNDFLSDRIEEIVIDCPLSEIPYLIQKTLTSIEQNSCTIVTKAVPESAEQTQLDTSKVKVLEFDDVNDAYEWFAQVKEMPEDCVVINRDNVLLNHILYTWDRPQVHSSLIQSNPQLLQFFKLGMSIFSRPLNIQNLISYLQLPMSPIPGALRYKLSKILLQNGGFGDKVKREDGEVRDDWEQAIHEFEFVNKEGKATPQARAKKMVFLSPIRNNYTDGIAKNELTDYLNTLNQWAVGHNADENLAEEKKAQLYELRAFISSLKTALQSLTDDKVTFDDLEKLVLQIYRPMNYTLGQNELGACRVVSNINNIATRADTILWLDCQEDDKENDAYDFLSQAERTYLGNAGAQLPDFASHLSCIRQERLRILSQSDSIILVRSAYNGTTRLGEHTMIAEVRQEAGSLPLADKDKLFPMIETKLATRPKDHFEPVVALELGPIAYKGRKESNSSLDTLIQLPFNYTIQYIAKLNEPGEEQLKNTYTTTGLVAHNFFEHIIEDGNKDLNRMRALTENEFDERLDKSIDATGLILRLPENTASLSEFRIHLKDSMVALIDIMEHLHLSPVGCEVSLPEEPADGSNEQSLNLRKIGNFGARIDFLLKDASDRYVIFDFKWSYSKMYKEKLESNTAIQLELYRETVKEFYKGKEVAAVGYYMMPNKQLVTTDFEEIADSRLIRKVTPANISTPLFEQIQHSYEFRMDEIRRGHIEEAETMDIKDLETCYHAKEEELGLCPLKVNEKTTGRGNNKQIISITKDSEFVFNPSKKFSFEDAKKEPCEIATSHAILKGRLK